jgi:hypothetical protein
LIAPHHVGRRTTNFVPGQNGGLLLGQIAKGQPPGHASTQLIKRAFYDWKQRQL